MRKLGRTRVWIGIAATLLIGCFVVGSANASLFGLFKGKSSRHTVSKPSSLIVFPFDQSQSIKAPAGMGEELAAALRTLLNGNKQYSPILYKEKLPPIKRAREDSTLKPEEDVAPFSDDQSKPLKLARLLAGDYFLVGAIEDLKIDAAKKTAEMTLSMNLVDAGTGKLVKTLLISGATPAGASGSQEDAIATAAGDAITKLKVQLLEEAKSGTVAKAGALKVTPKENAQPSGAPVAAVPKRNPGAVPVTLPSAGRVGAPARPGGSATPATPSTPAVGAGAADAGDSAVTTDAGTDGEDQPDMVPPAAPIN